MLHIIKPPFVLNHLPGIPLGHTSYLISLYTNPPTQGPATHSQSAINRMYIPYTIINHQYNIIWELKL